MKTISKTRPGNVTPFVLAGRWALEVRPRKDHRGVDLISDALPFGRLWYAYARRRSDFRMYFFVDARQSLHGRTLA
jgi:hypothetical protein